VAVALSRLAPERRVVVSSLCPGGERGQIPDSISRRFGEIEGCFRSLIVERRTEQVTNWFLRAASEGPTDPQAKRR
jgi:hypothetical protein